MEVKILLILLVISQISDSAKVSKDNVVLMVELIRHGARAPIVNVKKEKWIEATGNGELSETGKRMEFYLGLNTRFRYPNFFSKPLKYNEFWLRSTNYNRTIMSGISHTIGMTQRFVKNETLQFPNDDIRLLPPQMKNGALFNISNIQFTTPLPYGFQPFPIYTDFPDDEYLRMNECKGLKTDRVASFAATSVLLEKTKFFPGLFKWVLGKYGLTNQTFNPKTPDGNNSFVKANLLADFAIMDFLNNPKPTIESNDPNYGYLQDLQALQLLQRYNKTVAMKTIVTPTLTQIRTYFQNKIGGVNNKSYPLRYVLFSAHDTTISGHLAGMKPQIVNTTCLITSLSTGKRDPNCSIYPPVGSNIIWELVQNGTDYFAKISYNGVYLDYCNTNKTDGNGDFYCTMEEFDKTITGKINPDFKSYCGYETSGGNAPNSNSWLVWVYYGIIGVLLLYSVVVTIICLQKGQGYEENKTLDNEGYYRDETQVDASSGMELEQDSNF